MSKLTKIKILYAIPTFNRAGSISSHLMFNDPVLFVHSDQVADYKEAYPNVKVEPYTLDEGSIPRKKNFILDWAKERKYDVVFFIDDDYQHLICNGSGVTRTYKDPDFIEQVIESHAVLARDAKAPLFTFHNIPDVRRYARHKPFTLFTTFKRGNFGLWLDCKIRFDERFLLNEDVDLGLQALLYYRKIISDDRFSFALKKQMGAKGGLSNFRNSKKEQEYLTKIMEKWGYDLFKTPRSWAKRLSQYTVTVKNPFL